MSEFTVDMTCSWFLTMKILALFQRMSNSWYLLSCDHLRSPRWMHEEIFKCNYGHFYGSANCTKKARKNLVPFRVVRDPIDETRYGIWGLPMSGVVHPPRYITVCHFRSPSICLCLPSPFLILTDVGGPKSDDVGPRALRLVECSNIGKSRIPNRVLSIGSGRKGTSLFTKRHQVFHDKALAFFFLVQSAFLWKSL